MKASTFFYAYEHQYGPDVRGEVYPRKTSLVCL